LAEKRKDPEARAAAVRLFLIAAQLAPERLGRSCLLAMVPLAENELQQRRFRAMAYLLDPAHDASLLAMPLPNVSRPLDVDPQHARYMLRALRLLRQGKRREALLQARRIKMEDRLPQLTGSISYDEFQLACQPSCPHCQQGYQICPQCEGERFVDGRSCARCNARGRIACTHCGTDYRNNPLPPSLLRRILQLELEWLPASDATDKVSRAPHPSWSQSVQHGQSAPLAPLTLETITPYDPRAATFRDGQWTR